MKRQAPGDALAAEMGNLGTMMGGGSKSPEHWQEICYNFCLGKEKSELEEPKRFSRIVKGIEMYITSTD